MRGPANNPVGLAHAGILSLAIGVLMIVEGAVVALPSISFLIAPGILSAFAIVGLVSGGVFCWGGCILAGFITRNQKAAAIFVLVFGIAIGLVSFIVMVFAACGGGMSCPRRIPAYIYALPIAFAAFNAMSAALLWWRRRA